MKKCIHFLLAAVMLISTLGISAMAEDPQPQAEMPRILELVPTDDTKIDQSPAEAGKPHGSDDLIYISGNYMQSPGYQRYAYLKFDLTQVRADFEKAVISFRVPNDSANEMTIGAFLSDNNDWSEDTLTWNNADRTCVTDQAAAVGTFEKYSKTSQYGYIDLTQAVQQAMGAGKFQLTVVLRMMGEVTAAKSHFTHIGTKENTDQSKWTMLRFTYADYVAPELSSNVPFGPVEASGIDGNPNYASNAELGLAEIPISGSLDKKGYERYYFMKFDLRDALEREVRKVNVTVHVASGSDTQPFGLYKVEDVDWTANGLTYNDATGQALRAAMNDQANCLDTAEHIKGSTALTFDVTEYIRQQVVAGESMVTLGFRNVQNNGTQPYATLKSNYFSVPEQRPSMSIVFGNEPMQIVENEPVLPSDDAGVGPDIEEAQPEAVSAQVGGENYLFMKYDLRLMEKEAANVLFSMTGTADSEAAYGIYAAAAGDWNEWDLTFDTAAKEILSGEPAAVVRYPRADTQYTVDITDAALPALDSLAADARFLTVAVKGMDGANDGFGVYTKETFDKAPSIIIRFQKESGGGEIDPSHVDAVDGIPLDIQQKDVCLKDDESAAVTGTLPNASGSTIGYMRHYIMKFDLSGVEGRIKSATLHMTAKTSTATAHYGIYLGPDSSWTSEGATYNNFNKEFLQGTTNRITEITGVQHGAPAVFDITDGINKGLATSTDGLITLGLRNTNTNNSNDWAEFYTTKAANEMYRPYLVLELYNEETDPAVAVLDTELVQRTDGYVTAKTTIGFNFPLGQAQTVHVIFARCKDMGAGYRVLDVQEQSKRVYDMSGSLLTADFQLGEGEYIKVFVWNENGTRMMGQQSIVIQ